MNKFLRLISSLLLVSNILSFSFNSNVRSFYDFECTGKYLDFEDEPEELKPVLEPEPWPDQNTYSNSWSNLDSNSNLDLNLNTDTIEKKKSYFGVIVFIFSVLVILCFCYYFRSYINEKIKDLIFNKELISNIKIFEIKDGSFENGQYNKKSLEAIFEYINNQIRKIDCNETFDKINKCKKVKKIISFIEKHIIKILKDNSNFFTLKNDKEIKKFKNVNFPLCFPQKEKIEYKDNSNNLFDYNILFSYDYEYLGKKYDKGNLVNFISFHDPLLKKIILDFMIGKKNNDISNVLKMLGSSNNKSIVIFSHNNDYFICFLLIITGLGFFDKKNNEQINLNSFEEILKNKLNNNRIYLLQNEDFKDKSSVEIFSNTLKKAKK